MAPLKRNFSLPEDIMLGVEYLFYDCAICGTRDERGYLSDEFEMRWKF